MSGEGHPFINDISGLSIEELQDKLAKLYKNLSYANSIHNSQLAQQVQMLINSYSAMYAQKTQDELTALMTQASSKRQQRVDRAKAAK